MKIAYLIVTHNSPKHLMRLITALSTSSSCFFIHLDTKTEYDDFLSITGDNIYFTQERVPVYWGDFSQVEAILILLRTAFDNHCIFDRFVLLSGADYPLRSASFIEHFFEGNADKEFINMVPMPSEAAGKPISRLTNYSLRSGERLLVKIAQIILLKIGVMPQVRDYNSFLLDLAPYGGSSWWALTREACDYILNFAKNETRVVNFFKNTRCPDETFFQTILGNSHLKSRIIRNLTYADWSAGGANPAFLTEEHLTFFQSTLSFMPSDVYGYGEMLFARKFSDESESLVEKIRSFNT